MNTKNFNLLAEHVMTEKNFVPMDESTKFMYEGNETKARDLPIELRLVYEGFVQNMTSDYGLYETTKQEDYARAKETLMRLNDDPLCFEQVLIQCLIDGTFRYKLEDEGDDVEFNVTAEEAIYNIGRAADQDETLIDFMRSFDAGQSDVIETDAFLQYALLGELVYG